MLLRKLLVTAFFLAVFPLSQASGVMAGPVGSNVYSGGAMAKQPMGENLCAITFDDGPSVFTPHLLDMLDEYGIPATFFMLGRNARQYPDIVRRVVAEGHEIGVHTWSHPNLKAVSRQRKHDEIARTLDILRSLGADPKLMRPPYGNRDAAVDEIAAGLGLHVIIWSHDSEDWKHLPSDYSLLPDPYGHIARPGHLRGVFLFHDIHKTTVDDFPRIVAQLRAGGCQRFVTVSEYMEGFFTDPEPPMLMTRRAPSRSMDPALGRSLVAPSDGSAPAFDGPACPRDFAGRTQVGPALGGISAVNAVPAGLGEAALARAEAFVRARPWTGFAGDAATLAETAPAATASASGLAGAMKQVGLASLLERPDQGVSLSGNDTGRAGASEPGPSARPAAIAHGPSQVGRPVSRDGHWVFGRVTQDVAPLPAPLSDAGDAAQGLPSQGSGR